ncbi:putative FAD/FMN-containing dehydrogenase, glycolate oxidase, fused subunits GlcD and GlcF [Nitrospira sp. KM1]|uniref:FAD-binding and (Fe-S)-binding domain-containing protein n=1 Tax=Nitrospira sp. KM1 TaxID=1936990 RepID=UPI0013A77A5B|nr:FAD-binding and (Fe-S)-binding domain-containing protein [Nitrospira sp. KM1]BCA52910.1 putative FAD/FMN-containing dehydrogenase, glycolate oxidase, fused subunits GlcD and GlcF [Nitrospira sp. KM1]
MTLVMPEHSRAIASDLRRALGSDIVKDDEATKIAYAVDASIYRMVPQAIVLVETESHIETVVRYAVSRGIPLTSRAAGTNLTGSAVGSGIILDVSRMHRLLDINEETRQARVQPGLVLAELNKRLARRGLLFGPDPSSGEMCKLGGMLANNSAGPHTLRYGAVKDNVDALRVCLPSGEWLEARSYKLGDPSLARLMTRHPALSDVKAIVENHTGLLTQKRPTVSKNSAGYNLFGLADGLADGRLDLPKLFVGSEGTLGVFSEATIRLVDKPRATLTALIHFTRLEDVGDAIPKLLELNPSALEVMDANTLDLIGRSKHGIPADAAATLLAELDDNGGGGDLRERAERMADVCRSYRLASGLVTAFDQEQRDQLWKARKALYPTLYRFDPRKKPINYVDDVVVGAERISDLIRYLEELFKGQRVPVAIFGHIGNGNAHIVPLLDVNDERDFKKMVQSYHEIHDAVLTRFGGSICGEHGDGRVRAEYVRKMFGEELYGLFKRVKESFDPSYVFNPGVKISDTPFTEHIDYTRLSKSCATCAKCNAVCPVYDVFRSEDMSSRGWFEIVTDTNYSYLNSKRVVEACLNCKSCRTACPAGVDVSQLILDRRAEQPNKLAGWIFRLHAQSDKFAAYLKLLARCQWIWNRPLSRRILEVVTRPLLRRLAATATLSSNVAIPKFAVRQLRDRYPELIPPTPGTAGSPVAYFHGCAANYFDDGVGDAVIAVLRKHHVEPDLPPQRCSGTPIETYGHREIAKEGARVNLTSLAGYDTVVTGCASCTLMLKDYPTLFAGEPEHQAAEALAKRVKHISEFVAQSLVRPAMAEVGSRPQTVGYHSSCHLRAAGVTKEPRSILASMPGVRYVEMPDADRCAGGAGTYLVKDFDTSQRIVERKRRAVEDSGVDVVATSCPACMVQLRTGLPHTVEVKHVAQLLQERYDAADHQAGGD